MTPTNDNHAVGGTEADANATQALEELFKGSEAVDDSVLDGFYSIRDMDGFEKWISEHKSTLCRPTVAQTEPKRKILVLDLDNTLISRGGCEVDFVVDCENGCHYSIFIHPDCISFLHEMAAHYALISIFTSSSWIYATKIKKKIEERYLEAYPNSICPIRMVMASGHCTLVEGERKKDLLKFGSLDNVVFVDDDPYYSIRSQNDNVVQVRRYHGQESQQGGLLALVPLLSFLSSVESVPTTLRKLKKVWHTNNLVEIVQSTVGVTC
ncbi:hypothetical protein PGT21_009987 [Puccinia graminis f. sp. tritici]|uniref:Mitochondrial import inner membrane translocase subunit TIM50 n=2 Tax=Puccinia graminis f. sp. tritici TaxID=56615 RepID=E3KYF2_PUCGT|nr:uncharacterized protein PGTG_15522 [Puccinia graminis f. sp. tritici CRL 75-36-700-3]EFP89343.1 hypothetical protein PGTG_15522 [Puccinia graminis f. sp. tritici CRL 75-36-700-3]KAA1103209.1 hypothetical protein PGT21_009987 [Puccinia graminis f. sp. tritici]